MWKFFLSNKNGDPLSVTEDSILLVNEYHNPPMLPQKKKAWSHYLTDDGLSDGNHDMVVDGGTTNQTFYVQADDKNDRYISFLNIVIADEGAKFSEFGHITALTNGCQLYYENQIERVYAHETLKTNWDFVRMGLNKTPETEIKVQKDIEGKVDSYVSIIDFTKILPPYGIKLDVGTKEKLALVVRDDITGIDAFNAVVFGFERFE